MTPEDRNIAANEILEIFEWTRKKNKDFDLDEVDDKKTDKMRGPSVVVQAGWGRWD